MLTYCVQCIKSKLNRVVLDRASQSIQGYIVLPLDITGLELCLRAICKINRGYLINCDLINGTLTDYYIHLILFCVSFKSRNILEYFTLASYPSIMLSGLKVIDYN